MRSNKFLLFAKCLKSFCFWAYAFKIYKNWSYMTQTFFSHPKWFGVPKNAEFYADSKFNCIEIGSKMYPKKITGKYSANFEFFLLFPLFIYCNFFSSPFQLLQIFKDDFLSSFCGADLRNPPIFKSPRLPPPPSHRFSALSERKNTLL
jgi:hypothetical protein